MAAVRITAIFTENVNWDEFALLQRALTTAGTGELQGGGRPGLGTLVLIPYAVECRNAVDAIIRARVLWTVLVMASAGAFWFFLWGILQSSSHRTFAATLGLALWVMAPPFLRYSTQVRTDQPAILFGLLGGICLMLSRHRAAWAVLAGFSWGVGFLFTQKLLYVAALVILLVGARHYRDSNWRARREAVRLVLAVVGGGLTVLTYRTVIASVAGPPSLLNLSSGLAGLEAYRAYVGWDNYVGMLPALLSHLVAVATLLVLSFWWLFRRDRAWELAVSWCVLVLGAAVAIFHAGRFTYFYLVLGLFPAVIGALVTGPALVSLRRLVPRAAWLILLCVPLVTAGLLQALDSRVDRVAHQRESLAFVERNFSPEVRGFAARSELVCRHDPDPFPIRFTARVLAEFWGEDRQRRTEALMEEFRLREAAYMLLPLRREPFPDVLWHFWETRYVPYYGSIAVAGRAVQEGPGWTGTFEIVAPGRYVWRPSDGSSREIVVDGNRLLPGESLEILSPGPVVIALPDGGEGMFVLALAEPPSDRPTFYME